jgi:hypothetical protein
MKRKEVFVFGSREIKELPTGIEKILDTLMMLKTTILVGDCDGVDFAVQQYLYNNNYTRVKVFTSNKMPRNIMSENSLYTPTDNNSENLSIASLISSVAALSVNNNEDKTSINLPQEFSDITKMHEKNLDHGKVIIVKDNNEHYHIRQHLYRNDLDWKIISLYSESVVNKYGEDSREFYRIKDMRMIDLCDCGIAIWNGKSRATNKNVAELLSRNKKCTVFLRDLFK